MIPNPELSGQLKYPLIENLLGEESIGRFTEFTSKVCTYIRDRISSLTQDDIEEVYFMDWLSKSLLTTLETNSDIIEADVKEGIRAIKEEAMKVRKELFDAVKEFLPATDTCKAMTVLRKEIRLNDLNELLERIGTEYEIFFKENIQKGNAAFSHRVKLNAEGTEFDVTGDNIFPFLLEHGLSITDEELEGLYQAIDEKRYPVENLTILFEAFAKVNAYALNRGFSHAGVLRAIEEDSLTKDQALSIGNNLRDAILKDGSKLEQLAIDLGRTFCTADKVTPRWLRIFPIMHRYNEDKDEKNEGIEKQDLGELLEETFASYGYSVSEIKREQKKIIYRVTNNTNGRSTHIAVTRSKNKVSYVNELVARQGDVEPYVYIFLPFLNVDDKGNLTGDLNKNIQTKGIVLHEATHVIQMTEGGANERGNATGANGLIALDGSSVDLLTSIIETAATSSSAIRGDQNNNGSPRDIVNLSTKIKVYLEWKANEFLGDKGVSWLNNMNMDKINEIIKHLEYIGEELFSLLPENIRRLIRFNINTMFRSFANLIIPTYIAKNWVQCTGDAISASNANLVEQLTEYIRKNLNSATFVELRDEVIAAFPDKTYPASLQEFLEKRQKSERVSQ